MASDHFCALWVSTVVLPSPTYWGEPSSSGLVVITMSHVGEYLRCTSSPATSEIFRVLAFALGVQDSVDLPK